MYITQIKLYFVHHQASQKYFSSFFNLLICLALLSFATLTVSGEEQQDGGKYGNFFSSIREQSPVLIPKCNSPRATLTSFYTITKKIKIVFLNSSKLGDIQWKQERQLITLYSKLKFLVDSSGISEKEHFAKTNVLASQLADILDRIPVPELSNVPDANMVAKEQLVYWRIPDTEISMIRIAKGARQGDWVFSPELMNKISRFYEITKHLPWQSKPNVIRKDAHGLLEHYMDFTGTFIPFTFTDYLPNWMLVKFFEVPLWKYIGSFLVVVLLLFLTLFIHKLTRFKSDQDKNHNNIFLNFRRLLLPLFLIIFIPMAITFITEELRVRMIPLDVIDDTLWGLFFIVVFWLCLSAGNLIFVLIIHIPSFPHASFDASLVKIICRLSACFIGAWIAFSGLNELGVSMVPLIAGASVGGLAFALAVKPTLSNVISGMLIYADKPFGIGQRISIKGFVGDVESIGLRSTRIRTLDGHVVSIPNDEVCNTDLENIAKRPFIKRKFSVTITYDTPPEKITEAMAIIRQLMSIDEDQGMTEDELGRPSNSCINKLSDKPPVVYFNELNADSLNLLVIYYFTPPDKTRSLKYATWFNLQLIERFNRAGIKFAFPTQTIEYKPVT